MAFIVNVQQLIPSNIGDLGNTRDAFAELKEKTITNTPDSKATTEIAMIRAPVFDSIQKRTHAQTKISIHPPILPTIYPSGAYQYDPDHGGDININDRR